jgi:dynein heavy chain
MREYEEQLYIAWCQSVEANSMQYLKTHILLKETGIPLVSGVAGSVGNQPLAVTDAANGGGAAAQNADGKPEKVYVNFRPELREIIKETKYLDKLGFMVPEAALNVALQVQYQSVPFVFSNLSESKLILF